MRAQRGQFERFRLLLGAQPGQEAWGKRSTEPARRGP
jgi:hypothetical protein